MALCELYMGLDKHLIVLGTVRWELWRETSERWARWMEHTREIAMGNYTFVCLLCGSQVLFQLI